MHLKNQAFEADPLDVDFMDIYQSRQIKQAHRSVSQVADEVHHQRQATRDEIHALHERIDRLTVLCEAMWKVLEKTQSLTENDLAKMVTELDLIDGQSDRRKTRAPAPCPECEAMVSARSTNCQFCGATASVGSVFDAV